MFINEFDREGREAFLELAHRLVFADGVLTSEEEEMFAELERESEGQYSEKTTKFSLDALCGLIKDREARAKSLLELASLAHVDGDFDGSEKKLLEQVCAKWGIDKLSMIRAIDWAERRVESALEAADIIKTICDNPNEV